MNNQIDLEQCKTCGLCIEVCPCNIIGKNGAGEVHFIPERTAICLHCGQCMAICATKAITIDALSYDGDLVDLTDHTVDGGQFVTFLSHRRSVRNFKKKPVPKEIVEKVLASVQFAPFGSAPEKVHMTVVNNRQTIESALPYIADFLDNIVKWMENPVAAYMIKRKKGLETFNTIKHHLYPIAKRENYKLAFGDRITRHAPAIIIFHADQGAEEHTNNSLVYATYAMLTAHALGLGATMVGLVPAAINKVPEVRHIFRIPDEHDAVISVIMGYPKYKYKRAIKRDVQPVHWVE